MLGEPSGLDDTLRRIRSRAPARLGCQIAVRSCARRALANRKQLGRLARVGDADRVHPRRALRLEVLPELLVHLRRPDEGDQRQRRRHHRVTVIGQGHGAARGAGAVVPHRPSPLTPLAREGGGDGGEGGGEHRSERWYEVKQGVSTTRRYSNVTLRRRAYRCSRPMLLPQLLWMLCCAIKASVDWDKGSETGREGRPQRLRLRTCTSHHGHRQRNRSGTYCQYQ